MRIPRHGIVPIHQVRKEFIDSYGVASLDHFKNVVKEEFMIDLPCYQSPKRDLAELC